MEEPTGEGKTGGLERKRRRVRKGGRSEKARGDGEEDEGGSMKGEGERRRARMRVSISSVLSPPSRRPPSSAQLAKQQVLPAAQQISLEERLKLFHFFSFLF